MRDATRERREDLAAVEVSTPFQALDQARPAYRRCLQLLRLTARLELGACVVREEQFGMFAGLSDGQGAGDVRAFVSAHIEPFKARDRASGFTLSGTLLAYLDHGHSVRRTATL